MHYRFNPLYPLEVVKEFSNSNATVILSLSNSSANITCVGPDLVCQGFEHAYESLAVFDSHGSASGSRVGGSPSFLAYGLQLYSPHNSSLDILFIVDVFGNRVPVDIAAHSVVIGNKSVGFDMTLVGMDAPYRCFQLNKPFYTAAFIMKGAASAVITLLIFFIDKAWLERRSEWWRKWDSL